MATDGRLDAIIDSSTLVNFLKVNRADLLASHPDFRFIVVDAVRDEITRHYPAQVARLDAAFAAGFLLPDQPAASTSIAELKAFTSMSSIKIGVGERAAIAAARARGRPLAMDDERAWKRAGTDILRLDSASLVADLIESGALEADAADWVTNRRPGKRNFRSFAELLAPR